MTIDILGAIALDGDAARVTSTGPTPRRLTTPGTP